MPTPGQPTQIQNPFATADAYFRKQLVQFASVAKACEEEAEIRKEREENIQDTKDRTEKYKQENEQLRESVKENGPVLTRQTEENPSVEKMLDGEDQLKIALELARGQYATADFRDRTALQEIRKFFGALSSEKEAKEIPNIAAKREAYEKAVNDLKEFQLFKLKTSGLTGEGLKTEISKMLTYYNVDIAAEFHSARSEARMQYLDEGKDKGICRKLWDKARAKSTKAADWYNENVPTWAKAALFAGSFIPGASSFVLGKRTWGAFMMASAGGAQIDKLAQWKDKKSNKKTNEKNINEIMDKDGVANFDNLQRVLNDNIAGLNKKIRSQAWRSNVNKFVAIGSTIFLGIGTFNLVMDVAHGHAAGSTELIGKILNKFGIGSATSHVAESVSPKYALDVLKNSKLHGTSGTPLTDSMENPEGLHTNFAEEGKIIHTPANFQEALHTPAPEKVLAIHGSVEKTLIQELKANGVKNPGAEAHRMVLKFMEENPNTVPDEPNLVYESNNLVVEPNGNGGFHLKAIGGEGNWGHIEHVKPTIGSVHEVTNTADADITPDHPIEAAKVTEVVSKPDNYVDNHGAVPGEVPAEAIDPKILEAQTSFNQAHREYLEALKAFDHHVPDSQLDHYHEILSRSESVMDSDVKAIKGSAQFVRDQKEVILKGYKVLAAGQDKFMETNGNLTVSSAMADNEIGPRVKLLKKTWEASIKGVTGRSSELAPRSGETLRMWFAKSTNKLMESKYGILRQ